jgi:hypothetical protein
MVFMRCLSACRERGASARANILEDSFGAEVDGAGRTRDEHRDRTFDARERRSPAASSAQALVL